MKHAIQCKTIGEAFSVIKSMAPDEERWGEEVSSSVRRAYKAAIEGAMHDYLDRQLAQVKGLAGEEDRRNGSFPRHLLTAIGELELRVPRTRRFSAVGVIGAYQRRTPEVTRAILNCFVMGVSTRKVAEVLWPLLGERPSAGLVSRVAKELDAAVAAFHRRRFRGGYRFLILDGVTLTVRCGGARRKRLVLVALGVLPDGRKEVLDFAVARGESQASWEGLLQSLYNRGLDGEGLELIVCDGGKGLLAALPVIYPGVEVQRCWAHKIRNVLGKVRWADHEAVKADLHAICYADRLQEARRAIRAFRGRWAETYPAAVACLLEDEDQLLSFLAAAGGEEVRKLVRTTNAIERLFREVRRRTRPMGVFYDRTSIQRIVFAIFTYHNYKQKTGAPFSLLTQNS